MKDNLLNELIADFIENRIESNNRRTEHWIGESKYYRAEEMYSIN